MGREAGLLPSGAAVLSGGWRIIIVRRTNALLRSGVAIGSAGTVRSLRSLLCFEASPVLPRRHKDAAEGSVIPNCYNPVTREGRELPLRSRGRSFALREWFAGARVLMPSRHMLDDLIFSVGMLPHRETKQ